MLMSKRSVLRTLAAVLEHTEKTYARPVRGYRRGLVNEDNYQSHQLTTLRSVMAGMAQALSDNDNDEAKKLLESLTKKA